MKKKILGLGSIGLLAPFLAFAAATNVEELLSLIATILNSFIIPLLITLAVVYFIWGVIQYTVSQDEEAKKGARSKIIQGLIGLFIILTFWGIIALVGRTVFGSDAQNRLNSDAIPCIDSALTDC